MSIRPERENNVRVVFSFRREKVSSEGINLSFAQEAALDYLLKTRIIDRSIGKNETPFPLLEQPDRYETLLVDAFTETVRNLRCAFPRDDTVFFIDDDIKKIGESLSTLPGEEKPTVFILIDRERGVAEKLREMGACVFSVISATEINEFCKKNGYMTPKECSEMQSVIEKNRPFNGVGLA